MILSLLNTLPAFLCLSITLSHVTMSVVKLLSRIVTPDHLLTGDDGEDQDELVKKIHDHTYGITSGKFAAIVVILLVLLSLSR